MTPVDPSAPWPTTDSAIAQRPVTLHERLANEHLSRMSRAAEPEYTDPPSDQVFLPVPIPTVVTKFSNQMFKEFIFYGDEEMNGIPSLSIDL